jgi:hypothetical protein
MPDWLQITLGILGAAGTAIAILRWIIRNEVRALRVEVTPNGGRTDRLGDRVTRLETKQDMQTEFLCRIALVTAAATNEEIAGVRAVGKANPEQRR